MCRYPHHAILCRFRSARSPVSLLTSDIGCDPVHLLPISTPRRRNLDRREGTTHGTKTLAACWRGCGSGSACWAWHRPSGAALDSDGGESSSRPTRTTAVIIISNTTDHARQMERETRLADVSGGRCHHRQGCRPSPANGFGGGRQGTPSKEGLERCCCRRRSRRS